MKAIEQCFRVVLFIMLYKVVQQNPRVEYLNESIVTSTLICIVVYYNVRFLTLQLKSVDETLACDHSNEGY